ncbi:glucosaminidase domain-containing protein [Gracilinema caldarium]|uniref:Lipoprotein n=1 Tax=Gracilinema caldarium (strain ATCC 51460 / DSM 7334 / H1) TaxID=744872 RepID=F8EX89_GRAC1|nr:glucosaminidase domain-containing protein [Gracilinema caldarium]AEJ18832.1 putative lipoprotein [Gracilinema caldarium DSM 7334]
MKYILKYLVLLVSISFILGSCTSISTVSAGMSPEQPQERPPVLPSIPQKIMSTGKVPPKDLARFLHQNNPKISDQEALLMANLYHKEAALESVNSDIAFVQMCLETSFLRFGGLVTPDMHNYCGLGSIGPGKPGERFPTAQMGVRAHIQHLKAYASTEALHQSLVDPRFKYVRRGSAPSIHDLAGRWASDREYGRKLEGLLKRLYQSAFGIATAEATSWKTGLYFSNYPTSGSTAGAVYVIDN